jgi:hypothetical protein
MSAPQCVERDERTVVVENATYRWAYLVLTYALLVDVMYRGLFRNEAAWDLMALVIGGGAFCAGYQGRQKILAHGWVMKAVVAAGVAGIIAAVVAVVLSMISE